MPYAAIIKKLEKNEEKNQVLGLRVKKKGQNRNSAPF
jgi:hypothetical protein